jgi:hypothetical protein
LSDITKACDCVLWAGDMNFRVGMKHQEVLDCCKAEKFGELLLKDEFRTIDKKPDPYVGFKEAEISFPPTYKFDLRSTNDIYAKHRTPSYTVRRLDTWDDTS